MINDKESIKQWILRQRLNNYGYDWKWFRKMASTKARLKNKIKYMSDAEIRKPLAMAGILGSRGRLTRRGGKVDYTTGQSFNEELLNIMQLSASKGKKSFWEVQDKWSF